MFPLEFRGEVNRDETRASEDRMVVAGIILTWYQTVTDGETDGQTESVLCIASYADFL